MEIARKAYIDIHTHWLMFGCDSTAVLAELEWLEARGFEAIAMFPLPRMGAPPEKVIDLIPGFLREPMGLDMKSAANDDLESWWEFQRRWLARHTDLPVGITQTGRTPASSAASTAPPSECSARGPFSGQRPRSTERFCGIDLIAPSTS